MTCIEHLIEFAENEELRRVHLDALARKLQGFGYVFDRNYQLVKGASVQYPNPKVSAGIAARRQIDWLRVELAKLQPLLKRLGDIVREHRPVIYAVRLDEPVSKGLSPMGIEVTKPIGPERILARADSVVRRDSFTGST